MDRKTIQSPAERETAFELAILLYDIYKEKSADARIINNETEMEDLGVKQETRNSSVQSLLT